MVNITKFLNKNSCFDLQFRKDVKHNRANKPTYYCWKAQFVVTGDYQSEEALRELQNLIGCGRLNFVGKNKIRYSVQSIDGLKGKVLPFFAKFSFSGNKKLDFELWAEAIKILFKNKGKRIKPAESVNSSKQWQKKDFLDMIEIQKKMQNYKVKKIQGEKWLSVAESIYP